MNVHSDREGFQRQLGEQLPQVENINNCSRHFHYNNNIGLKFFVYTSFQHVDISCEIEILVIELPDMIQLIFSLDCSKVAYIYTHTQKKTEGSLLQALDHGRSLIGLSYCLS